MRWRDLQVKTMVRDQVRRRNANSKRMLYITDSTCRYKGMKIYCRRYSKRAMRQILSNNVLCYDCVIVR